MIARCSAATDMVCSAATTMVVGLAVVASSSMASRTDNGASTHFLCTLGILVGLVDRLLALSDAWIPEGTFASNQDQSVCCVASFVFQGKLEVTILSVEGFDVHEVGSTSKLQRPAHSPQVFRLLVKEEASFPAHPAQPGVGGVTRQADLVLASLGNVEVAVPLQLKVMPAAFERSQTIAANAVPPARSTMNVRILEVDGLDVGPIDWSSWSIRPTPSDS